MDYEVEYRDSRPTKLKFKPSPVDSKGTYDPKLFGSAMTRFCPDGWGWDGQYLYSRVIPDDYAVPSSLCNVVSVAQEKITDMMDRLGEFQDFLLTLKEYKGGQKMDGTIVNYSYVPVNLPAQPNFSEIGELTMKQQVNGYDQDNPNRHPPAGS